MAEVIELADHRQPMLGYVSSDLVLRVMSKLPRTADLETRLQTLIAAGATDRQIEIYAAAFASAQREA